MIAVYAVGLLADLRSMALFARVGLFGMRSPGGRQFGPVDRKAVRHGLRVRAGSFLRNLPRQARRRSYWNGYLAEPEPPFPDWAWTRCGHGWTKARARRSLARHVLARLAGGEV